MKLRIIFFLFFALYINSSAYAEIIASSVNAEDGLKCQAYLFKSTTPTNALVLEMQGTGIYSNKKESPALATYIKRGKVDRLVFDKPGIFLRKSIDTDNPDIDEAIFQMHTQNTLLDCAEKALSWAQSYAKNKKYRRIYLRGHSEGAQLSIALYKRLQAKPELANAIKQLWLTGLPLEQWKTLVTRQLELLGKEKRDQYWKAINECDWKFLRENGETPCGYLKAAFEQPSTREDLVKLRESKAKASIQVFQGLSDVNAKTDDVFSFDKENQALIDENKPALNFQVRYYAADHGMNDTSKADLIRLISSELR